LTLGVLALWAGASIGVPAPAGAAVAGAPQGVDRHVAARVNTSVETAAVSDGGGYWLVASDGGIFSFGGAGYYGSTGSIALNKPIVGMAQTPDHGGYWLVAADGGIFSFGDAQFYGSTGGIHLNKPIVGMAATPDGKGYWLVAADGGIFAFGDAGFYGSTGAISLNKPIVGMATTPNGKGYWLVASDGGIFAFGDAQFYGSTGNIVLNKPIVGMAATPGGGGYWLVASDGGLFSFGDAGFFGSVPNSGVDTGDIVSMASTSSGQGYWIAGSDGSVFSFGDASVDGSIAGTPLNKPIVGFAAAGPIVPPLSVSSGALPGATVGTGYSESLSALGGTAPYTWTVAGGALPEGLSLSAAGVISGVPVSQGSSNFTVRVSDSSTPVSLTASATLAVSVSAAPLVVTTSTLANATVGTAYTVDLGASGGSAPYSWALTSGALPVGLSLSATGVISGMPTTQGSSSFTVRVTDASTPAPLSASVTLSIAVGAPAVPTVLSPNWSGYAEDAGPFSAITGTFNVPYLEAGTPTADRVTEWVGIDGAVSGDTSLIQAGVDEYPDASDPSLFYIQPWWEILPAAQTNITTMAVHAGDQVTVTIGQISGSEWEITVADDTDGQSFSTDQVYTGPESSAEWIVEAPEVNGQITTLAPYSPDVDFSDLRMTGSNTELAEWILVQDDVRVSTPSALTAAGFNVAYGGVAPAAP
jgi:hypothetical protein